MKFTNNYSKNTKPIHFVIRGKGEIIYDGNQKRYLDFTSQQTNVLIFKPPLITFQKSFLEAFDILGMILKRIK